MIEILLVIVIILLIVNIYISIKPQGVDMGPVQRDMEQKLISVEKALREEFTVNREESRKNEQSNRTEIGSSIEKLSATILSNMIELSNLQKNQFDTYSRTMERTLDAFNYNLRSSIDDLTKLQNEKFVELTKSTEENLEKMRVTVDEKLQSTLERRLSESFKVVSERLEQVHKGLGEMQSLAAGVGDLKKVLSNTKTRGVLGEVQLERILEQFLSPEQYEKNVITKKGSRETVEFAIKLPGKDYDNKTVYLPLDAKFPLEVYNKLLDAYDLQNQAQIDAASKNLERFIKKSAKDIRDKYIDPPNTTDFGLMFLPTEGIYAEVLKNQSLVEFVQREYNINITGPTTLVALLNSLQMGFRSLAIEKHSSEVWKILGAVKTEFSKFETVLNSAQNKLNQASSEIDKLVGTRTRQINRKLKNVDKLSFDDTGFYLSSEESEEE
ncbi:DNA recombination protein RmuC [Intestinibacter bartlettii DSM 16795]|jgi:DNA recombination protein RmuC|uniref:DNA recombination protein RmuC n=1 Tax=Intestinibacter bartlettii TaxID=261299 RepID=UPI0001631478|nr:DNA recombination protein RmuC [Intestinibacter bartlettii]EDQ97448.1 RmuC domain protein [Intestinibacter bartlettii DSM 16795]MEE0618246.1 DNA recombination protein RmuC [Intestinibacter bartlettii]UWO81322.1 DNA recombination protein RmuC [Intestinibacter bartlettii]CUP14011.1 RmuC family [Intestinibacter bartlettii]SKA60160.1 DNA recombination protein RmuC [Intestinibacter bartlettii DSM 16795]